MANTLYKEHREAVVFGVDEYENFVVEIWSFLGEGGKIPGLEEVPAETVRAFFRQIPAAGWFALTRVDPQRALTMLQEFVEVERGDAQ